MMTMNVVGGRFAVDDPSSSIDTLQPHPKPFANDDDASSIYIEVEWIITRSCLVPAALLLPPPTNVGKRF